MNPDPLENLLVDRGEIDRAALAEGLAGIMTLNRADGHPCPAAGFDALSSRRRVLAFFLSTKAAFLLGLRESESLTAKQLEDLSGIPGGTVRPKITELKNSKLLRQSDDGGYYIPASRLGAAIAELSRPSASGAGQ